MFWVVVILAIVAYGAYRFFSDVHQEGEKVKAEGGMRNKYSTLVEWALSGHQDCRILSESSTDIVVGAVGASGSTTFQFVQSFNNRLIVKYEMKSIVFGNHTLNWTFNESIGQEAMIDKMEQEIAVYMKQLMQKFQ